MRAQEVQRTVNERTSNACLSHEEESDSIWVVFKRENGYIWRPIEKRNGMRNLYL